MKRPLWDHQTQALDALRTTIGQRVKRIVLESPTGSGKTVIAASIVEGALSKGHKVAFVAAHLGLIDQTAVRFTEEGIDKAKVGIIQAKHRLTDWEKPIQICSVQTLHSQGKWPEAKIVIIDECHVLHEEHKRFIEDANGTDKIIIGLSATPWTKGLAKYFDTKITVTTTLDLIKKGLLSKFRCFATGHPDLSGVKIVAGDYHEGQLSEAMQKGPLVADIIKTWKERHGQDKTLVFAVDCAHAQAIQQRFIEAGIRAGYQDANTTMLERAEIAYQFARGDLPIVCNVGTLTTGIDWDVRCIVLARPTRSEMLYVQIIGRGLRTAEGKNHCLILDHSDTTERLGFVTDIYHEHLDDGKPTEKAEPKKRLPKPCPQCDCMMPRVAGKCPNCGFEMPAHISGLVEANGELVEVTDVNAMSAKQRKRESSQYTMAEKARFFAGAKWYAQEKHYKESWAANLYREKFKVWPNDPEVRYVAPEPPTMEVRSYIKSRQIAYIKGKQAKERMAMAAAPVAAE